jgi:hypothetical protein
MFVIELTNAANALQGILVAEMASKRIRRIGWISDDAAGSNNIDCLLDQARLRIRWMYMEKLTHSKDGLNKERCSISVYEK